MGFEDLLETKPPRHWGPGGLRRDRGRYDRRGPRRVHLPVVVLAVLRVVRRHPWLLATAAMAVFAAVAGGIWASFLAAGFLADHGVRGVLEAALRAAAVLWEGRGPPTTPL